VKTLKSIIILVSFLFSTNLYAASYQDCIDVDKGDTKGILLCVIMMEKIPITVELAMIYRKAREYHQVKELSEDQIEAYLNTSKKDKVKFKSELNKLDLITDMQRKVADLE